MPPGFKDSWCLLVSDPAFGCWQLCQTILRLGGNFLFFFNFFSRVGCGLQLNFGGKFQRGRQAVSKSEGTGK